MSGRQLSVAHPYQTVNGFSYSSKVLGRHRRRWVDNIRMDLQEAGCRYMDWVGLAQDRDRWRTLVSAVMNFRVPWNAGNFLTSCKPVSFSRRTLHHGVSKDLKFPYYMNWTLPSEPIPQCQVSFLNKIHFLPALKFVSTGFDNYALM